MKHLLLIIISLILLILFLKQRKKQQDTTSTTVPGHHKDIEAEKIPLEDSQEQKMSLLPAPAAAASLNDVPSATQLDDEAEDEE